MIQNPKSKIQNLCFIILMVVGVLIWVLDGGNIATAGPYLDSAHGNTSYGVNRSSMSIESGHGYAKGNCAHCHEMHASVGGTEPDPASGSPSKYTLFKVIGQDQNSSFCYGCHQDSGTSLQYLMLYQYNYSRIAGGDTTITCPDDIKEVFVYIKADCSTARSNCGSSVGSAHCLWDIQNFLKNNWNFPARANVQACSGCHNPHRAQRDGHAPATRGWPLSRPSQHSNDNNLWELWGDDTGEKMSDYTGNYQAPYRYGSTTTYEPDGSSTTNGSNLVDSVTFCLDCHSGQVSSTRYGTLSLINWGAGGDEHGQNWDSGSGSGPGGWQMAAPYVNDVSYVLSCLDCHEPHGSQNEYLLRQTVNGNQVPLFSGPGRYYYFCQSCHAEFHWGSITDDITCSDCHYHNAEF